MSTLNDVNFNTATLLKTELLTLLNELKTNLNSLKGLCQTEPLGALSHQYGKLFSAFFGNPCIKANISNPLLPELMGSVFPNLNSSQNVLYILLKSQTNFRPTINQQDLQNTLINYISLRHGAISLKVNKELQKQNKQKVPASLEDVLPLLYPKSEMDVIAKRGTNIMVHYAPEKEFLEVMMVLSKFVQENVKDLSTCVFSLVDNVLMFECPDELTEKHRAVVTTIKHLFSTFKKY